MAEAHPVGFRWVMKARERGATIIHVDPRFSRTSAMADLHVPIRAGTDIAFLGGLINHVLETESWFKEYVLAYTNATTLINENFEDAEDLGGLFSGFDPETGSYDPSSWMYEGGQIAASAGQREHGVESFEERTGAGMLVGEVESDMTLQDPRCVLNIVRRHFARYTPEMVERVTGCPKEVFLKVAEAMARNSGRERTGAICYAVGWNHHTKGAQVIRAGAILQALLGNVGRPGGGMLALRGHTSQTSRREKAGSAEGRATGHARFAPVLPPANRVRARPCRRRCRGRGCPRGCSGGPSPPSGGPSPPSGARSAP